MRWVRDFRRALKLNLARFDLQHASRGNPQAADMAADWWRENIRYHFAGPLSHRIVSLAEVQRRGWGACGDACAFVGAAALASGQPAELCIEAVADLENYSHVSLVVNDYPLDPTAEYALEPNVGNGDGRVHAGLCRGRLNLVELAR